MLGLSALIASVAYFAAPAAAHAATQLQIEMVTAQFGGALIVPTVLPEFKPIGLFQANYSSTVKRITVGQVISAANTTAEPIISIRATEAAEDDTSGPLNDSRNSTVSFTVVLFDANYPGSANPDGYNVHWLANGLSIERTSDNQRYLSTANGTVVVPYAGPAPPEGTGPHRYVFLAYLEPEEFAAPTTPAVGTGVALLNFVDYVSAAKLGSPIAGTYFTVETGTATVSASPTTSINNSTLPAFTITDSHGADHPSTTGTSTTTSNAQMNLASVPGFLFAVLAGFMLA